MTKRPAAQKSRPRNKSLRVAIIVDPYGSVSMDRTGADEIAEHKADLTKLLRGHRLTFTAPSWVDDKMSADLVIFDFGGMSIGNDLMADNSRRLIRWAQDHSSSLIVVVSMFTWTHGVFYELRELGIVPDDAPLPSSFDDSATSPLVNVITGSRDTWEKAIKEWFK